MRVGFRNNLGGGVVYDYRAGRVAGAEVVEDFRGGEGVVLRM